MNLIRAVWLFVSRGEPGGENSGQRFEIDADLYALAKAQATTATGWRTPSATPKSDQNAAPGVPQNAPMIHWSAHRRGSDRQRYWPEYPEVLRWIDLKKKLQAPIPGRFDWVGHHLETGSNMVLWHSAPTVLGRPAGQFFN